MSFNLPPIPAAKRPPTTLIKARIRKHIKTGSFNPAILISLQTRQEQLSCFDMLAKNTGGWGAHFLGEQSKYSVILNGTSSSAGTPACAPLQTGRAQERSSPSQLSDPSILISLPTRQEQLTCFDMLAKAINHLTRPDYSLYCDSRLGGIQRWSVGKPPGYGMRVADDILDCICYLSVKDKSQSYKHGGTAFLLGVPIEGNKDLNFPYLVTAKHCVERAKEYGNLFVRLNSETGEAVYVETNTADWIYSDDESEDAAVL